MKFLLQPVAHRYRTWMDRWENELCFRSTDRVVRPFEYGLEWTRNWPCAKDFPYDDESDPVEYLIRLNERAIAQSDQFFGYDVPASYELEDNWLSFTSPVETPFPENNQVR